MSRVQLALRVADLDAAVDFYSRLFAAEPAKRRPGYANFAIAEPPLKLVLLEGDPVRLRLLSLIASHDGGEACVCDLSGVFDLTGPTISHHLKVLREAGLIAGERRGTWVYYRVLPDALRQVSALVALDAAPA